MLSREELRELWPVLHDGEPLSDVLLMMLLTAQRRGEVSRMRWQDIDLHTGWWTIPAEASKNADPHRVPLIPEARALLKRRWSGERDECYVFSTLRETCVAHRAKKVAAKLCRNLSFQFRAHDLRRTVASYMGQAGIDRFHIALVLNHRSVTHNSVTAIYDRYRYDNEKRAALKTWARLLGRILKPQTSTRIGARI